MTRHSLMALVAGSALIGGLPCAQAQSNDALLNKLVSKGILSSQEADDLKKEADAGFDKAYRSKTGLPEWVTSLKISGDFRGRTEGFWTENSTPAADSFNNDRWRLRYRLRVGAVATFKDNLELGFRLTSGEPVGGFGGAPISSNSTLQDNGSKKFVYLDQAYGRWTPINNDTWKVGGTIGKMENPFTVSTIILDDDYTPEGVAVNASYALNKEHGFKFTGGYFVLDEIGQGGDSRNDAGLLGAQLRWDAKWNSKIESTLGAGIFVVLDEQSLTNGSVPNVNAGNTRLANGALLHDYTPIVVDAALAYNFDSMPLYKGKFPVRPLGTFLYNPGAPEDNIGYEAGIAFGKAGKKGTWELSYRWRHVEADAWYEELTDSDAGGFYQVAAVNSGLGTGYRAGSNIEGNIIKVSYSPYDSLTFSISYYLVDLIDAPKVAGRHAESGMSRMQIDAVWKF